MDKKNIFLLALTVLCAGACIALLAAFGLHIVIRSFGARLAITILGGLQ